MSFVLNPRKSHREQLLAMVNFHNQATIGTPLTIANTLLSNKTVVDAQTGATSVRLTNSKYANDIVDITYTRLSLADFVSMELDDQSPNYDFGWYTPDTWVPETSPGAAVAALKAAASRQNVDLDLSADSVEAIRVFDDVLNRYKLVITINSFVWQETVEYVMPRHFSEEITVTNLNGLTFTPITAESVVD